MRAARAPALTYERGARAMGKASEKTDRLFIVIIAMALSLSAGAVGCERVKVVQTYTQPIQKFFDLMSKTEWSPEDKKEFLDLFTIRGLNQFLSSQGVASFEELETKRLQSRPWTGKLTIARRVTEDKEATASLAVPGRVISSAWQTEKTADLAQKYFVAQSIFIDKRLYDLQVKDALMTTRPTLASVAVGAGIVFYALYFFFSTRRKGCFAALWFWIIVGTVVQNFQEGQGWRGVVLSKEFAPRPDDPFSQSLPVTSTPYPGPPRGALQEGIQQGISDEIRVLRLAGEASNERTILAQSLRDRALERGARGDAESTRQAVTDLHRSLMQRYSHLTMIDLAYFMSCLGQLGVNPELNSLRAESILSDVQNSDVSGPDESLVLGRSTAVQIINLLATDGPGDASNLPVRLETMIKRTDTLARDERVLEARYLLASDWAARASIADELVRASPNNTRYYDYKGLAAWGTNDTRMATASFERALAINAAYSPARGNLTRLKKQEGGPEQGLRTSEKPTWEAEPEGYPFYRLAVFRDLMNPPVAALAPAGESVPGVTGTPAGSPSPSFWKAGLAGTWNLRSTTWKRIPAIFGFMFLSSFIMAIIGAACNEGLVSAPGTFFWGLVLGLVLYVVGWGVDGLWSYVILVIYSIQAGAFAIANNNYAKA